MLLLSETEEGTHSEILQGKIDFESDPWPSISDSAKDLIRNMLTRDPKKRFSAHEVLCKSTLPRSPHLSQLVWHGVPH